MISTNELSFPMPAANLIAQRDPMRFVDTALYADDVAAHFFLHAGRQTFLQSSKEI